jgi:hypothetical protein
VDGLCRVWKYIPRDSALPLPGQTMPNAWASLTSLALHHKHLTGGFDLAMAVTGTIQTIHRFDLDLTSMERFIYGPEDCYQSSTYELFTILSKFVQSANSLKQLTCRHTHLRMVDHPEASSPMLWARLDLALASTAALRNLQLCVGIDCTTNWQLDDEDSCGPEYQNLYSNVCNGTLSQLRSLFPMLRDTGHLLVYRDDTDSN